MAPGNLGTVVHRLDELDGRAELRPPVLVLTLQPLAVEAVDVLERRQQARWVRLFWQTKKKTTLNSKCPELVP